MDLQQAKVLSGFKRVNSKIQDDKIIKIGRKLLKKKQIQVWAFAKFNIFLIYSE